MPCMIFRHKHYMVLNVLLQLVHGLADSLGFASVKDKFGQAASIYGFLSSSCCQQAIVWLLDFNTSAMSLATQSTAM